MRHGLGWACCLVAVVAGQVHAEVSGQGPSSSDTSYVVPVAQGVQTHAILTAGDSVNKRADGSPYLLSGTPDGLGAFDNGDGTFTLLVNHEFGKKTGIQRVHGKRGAFVSKWIIHKKTTRVIHGEDLVQQVINWDRQTQQYKAASPKAFEYLCSATLMPKHAFFDQATGLGTHERLYFNGEEIKHGGYAYVHIVDGPQARTSYELPRLGRAAWENVVPHPATGAATILISLDDSMGGQLYLYQGQKQRTGNVIEKAGLTNGQLYGIAVQGVPAESREQGIGPNPRSFSLVLLGNGAQIKGMALEEKSVRLGVTAFHRPEDGHWDPSHLTDFYFTTTDRYDIARYPDPEVRQRLVKLKVGKTADQVGRTRLWRLRFKDRQNLMLGGTLEVLLDSQTCDIQMLDNIAMDRFGHVLMLEDTANSPRNPKVWQYTIADGTAKCLAELDPVRFGSLDRKPTLPFTRNVESSGIIDASDLLGPGWFLLSVQPHGGVHNIEQAQAGQLVALYNPDSDPSVGSEKK